MNGNGGDANPRRHHHNNRHPQPSSDIRAPYVVLEAKLAASRVQVFVLQGQVADLRSRLRGEG